MNMEKERLKQILFEQRSDFLNKKTGIQREKLKESFKYLNLPHIYVITGIRRCGKSTLMRQIAAKYYPKNNFFFLSFEDERLFNFDLTQFNQILELQIELFGNHQTFFIDEIQNVPNFELFLRRLCDSGYKFIISGSNAELLSGELATKITGRHIQSVLRPFNFREYLKFRKIEVEKRDLYKSEKRALISRYFEEYLLEGGMPEYLTYRTNEIVMRMYEDILIKDIAARYGITNIVQLRELSRYLISNFGRRFSYNSLQKAIRLGSVNTAISYSFYLEQSYLIQNINKFDHSLKKQQVNEKKTYVADHSIIRNVSTQLTKDTGRILENIVANTLLSHSSLFYFSGNGECDFVAIDNNKSVTLFQVCDHLNSENSSREIKGMVESLNFFNLPEGIIITHGQEEEIETEGKKIYVTPIWKWLLSISEL
jgi:hypothetical protein